ncbi:MAG: ATP-binding protein [Bdellovibrionota bacterium]
MQSIEKFYPNILQYKLENVLFEVKGLLSNLPSLNDEVLFKIEFILEEFITNSFSHLDLSHNCVDIRIKLHLKEFEIEYEEIGVDDLNFAQILLRGQEKNLNPSLEQPGGLGLNLIQQISKKIEYSYNKNTRTRCFKVQFL